MRMITHLKLHELPTTPLPNCRISQQAQHIAFADPILPKTRKRVRRYHATRWNRLQKYTLPNLLVVFLKHSILGTATFAACLILITLFLPKFFDHRFLIAGAAVLPASLLPLGLKGATLFLFNKAWRYRHCITPFVVMACACSTLPGFLLLKKGPPKAIVQHFQEEEVITISNPNIDTTPLQEDEVPTENSAHIAKL